MLTCTSRHLGWDIVPRRSTATLTAQLQPLSFVFDLTCVSRLSYNPELNPNISAHEPNLNLRLSRNALLDMLKIEHPIVQAPMAGVSTPEMAAAVIENGGMGSLGVGAVDASAARQMIPSVRSRTQGPLNINVFCHPPALR